MMNNNKKGFDGGSKQLKNGYKIDVEMGAAAADCGICAICLDPVSDDGKRSWAKLQCRHQFHLDCIGSAFNAKGVMECPNCRKVEKGEWLFANGSTTQSRGGNNPISFDVHEYFPDVGMGLPVLGQSFHDEWDAVLDIPDLSGLFSVGYSSYSAVSLDDILHSLSFASSGHINPAPYGYINEEPESIPMHPSSRRQAHHIHRHGGDEQQRATPVSFRHRSGRFTTHPNSLQRTRDRVQALQAYRQQSSNPVYTQASFGASGSRSNNNQNNRDFVQALQAYPQQSRNPVSTQASFGAPGSRSNNNQNNNTRNRNVPPIPYSSNHAANNHFQSNSSLGRENYHHQEQVHGRYEYDYEPHVDRPQRMRRRRSEFEGSRHSQNQGRF